MTYWIASPSTATPLSAENLNRAQHLERKRSQWEPSATIDATLPRLGANSTQALLTSGTLRLTGGVVIPANEEVTNISVISANTAAVTPTNQWFCLVRQSDLSVLAKTVDDTTAAWNTFIIKTLALSTPYTPSVEEAVYIGVVVVAGTVPQLLGVSVGLAALNGLTPIAAGNSTTTLTNPASLGATAAAVTSSALAFYAYLT